MGGQVPGRSGPDSKPRVAVVYGRTRTEANQKLEELLQAAARGEPVKPERITVGEHLEDWLAQKKRQVASGT